MVLLSPVVCAAACSRRGTPIGVRRQRRDRHLAKATDRYTSDMARGTQLEHEVLDAVGQLIYREGINLTGVDRLSGVAGVSKRTLYQRFHSKDELVGRALAAADPQVAESVLRPGVEALAAGADGAASIRAVYRALRAAASSDSFRGCPFVNAAIELTDPDHPAQHAIRTHKERVRAWFESAARAGGLDAPASLSRQLMVVLDGFYVDSLIRPGVDAAEDAIAVVDALLVAAGAPAERATPSRARRRRGS